MAVNRYDQDEEFITKFDATAFKKVFKYVKPYRKMMFKALSLMVIISLVSLILPYVLGIVIDTCIPNKDLNMIIYVGLILLAMYFINMLISKIEPPITHKMGINIISDIRRDLFEHMQYLPFSYFDSRPHGKILVRVVNYLNAIIQYFSSGILGMIVNVIKVIFIAIILFLLDLQFGLLSIVSVAIFFALIFLIRIGLKKSWARLSSKQSNLNAYIQESLLGMKITQAFARENKNFEIFDNICEDNKESYMDTRKYEILISNLSLLFSDIIMLLMYIFGFFRVINSTMTIGLLISFVAYVNHFWTPINAITTVYSQLSSCSTYLSRIFQMLEEPLVISDVEGASDLPCINGNVSFKGVTFSYDKVNVLEDVSFDVKKGETIALVGPTGAGKSTIVNLLSRFYDINSGEILIDGYNIKDVTLKSLRSQMGIMMQDSFLFTGTILENIKYSRIDATDEEVIEAAKTVCAHDFIMEFPDGYNTMLNEGGSILSSGQKQLIAFARTLLANPAILILDEATSSIDTETEMLLQKGLERLLEGRTSFIIAHRLSTIKNSTKIMYIDNKNIAECGSHDDLLSKKGKYYNLYMAQYKFLNDLNS